MQNELNGSLGGSFHNKVLAGFFKENTNLKVPFFIYYDFQFCVYMGFLCVQIYVTVFICISGPLTLSLLVVLSFLKKFILKTGSC